MSIKKSLRILLILSSIIPFFVTSIIALQLLTNRLVVAQSNNILSTAQSTRVNIESLVNNQITEVSLLGIQSDIQQLVKESNQGKLIANDRVNAILNSRLSTYSSINHISVYNIDRTVVASTEASLIGSLAINDLSLSYMSTTGEVSTCVGGVNDNTFNIGTPIYDSQSWDTIGYIISNLNTAYLSKTVAEISVGGSGFGILLDRNGTILYHQDEELIGTSVSPGKLSELVSNIEKGLTTSDGHFQYTYDKVDQIFSYSYIPQLNWVLLIKQDLAEVQSINNIMLASLVIICLVLIILVSIFANVLAKRYTAPIISLRDAMRTAAEGNLTAQSNIKATNELGELSKNFNKMMHIIKNNYDDLSNMHEELLSNEEQLRSNYDHIEFLAYHDTLTSLPNKLALLNYVEAVLTSPETSSNIYGVYFLDLDNFKTINDTLGHEYGDELLVKTSQKLALLLEDKGMLARAGGDEFIIFKEDISSKEEAASFANEIIECFKSPLNLDGEMVYVSMSIGVAVYPEDGLSSNALIKNADIAMYKSKDSGKNKCTMFNAKMEEELNRNTMIIEVLHNAIENNEIYIQYQPLLNLKKNEVVGYEALMRIHSERLGYLSPNEFIPIAEETGLIIELSTWLLREACSFNKELIDKGIGPCTVSVNISSVQLNQPDFVELLSGILEETKLPPKYLEIEITESTLVSSITDATLLLTTLQELGIKISLDDFGTGYSSLNYLTKLPINTLKIDKSFIDNICSSSKDTHIAETIIQLAHSLNIQVVAEGVEDMNQLALLKRQKCDIIQGFIFSEPLHPPALVDVILETA
ncbi:MAG TPA: EAL domain-containing protein [Clostridiales bacterium]|nr:EAL domain-containing protein [Clostridiales bacterium]